MRRSCLSGAALHCDLAVPISGLISDNIDANTSEIVVKSDFFVWQSIYIRVRWDGFDLRVKSETCEPQQAMPMVGNGRNRFGAEQMEELRLPWNGKEGFIYGTIIAAITCFIMCEFNIFKGAGEVTMELFVNGLISLPFVWIAVMLLITFIVGPVANRFVRTFTVPSDSFYPKIVFNIIACVLMMSMTMTIVGPSIGHIIEGNLTIDVITNWPVNWPVNFCVAFWVEMLIAQPTARAVMKRKHIRMMKAQKQTEGA